MSEAPTQLAEPTLADIYAAKVRIAPYLWRTSLFPTATLSRMTGTLLRLKAENLQRTGSFKVRGAFNAVMQLSPEQKARGVVTISAGNHGQAMAFAARQNGVACTVFMAANAVQSKVDAIRGYGAEIRFGENIQIAWTDMDRHIEQSGALFVSPFSDAGVIAGQGTVGLEILEDYPEVEQIVVGVGGGGLISGVALAVKLIRPEVRIVGVEPAGATAVWQALQAGKPVRVEKLETIADGLAAPFTDVLPLQIVQKYVDDVVIVSDDEIVNAMRLLMTRCKQVVEPAGAAALAAMLTNRAAVPTGAHTVAVLSGGNVDLERLKTLL